MTYVMSMNPPTSKSAEEPVTALTTSAEESAAVLCALNSDHETGDVKFFQAEDFAAISAAKEQPADATDDDTLQCDECKEWCVPDPEQSTSSWQDTSWCNQCRAKKIKEHDEKDVEFNPKSDESDEDEDEDDNDKSSQHSPKSRKRSREDTSSEDEEDEALPDDDDDDTSSKRSRKSSKRSREVTSSEEDEASSSSDDNMSSKRSRRSRKRSREDASSEDEDDSEAEATQPLLDGTPGGTRTRLDGMLLPTPSQLSMSPWLRTDYTRIWDLSSQQWYYHNPITNDVSWTCPPPPPPPPPPSSNPPMVIDVDDDDDNKDAPNINWDIEWSFTGDGTRTKLYGGRFKITRVVSYIDPEEVFVLLGIVQGGVDNGKFICQDKHGVTHYKTKEHLKALLSPGAKKKSTNTKKRKRKKQKTLPRITRPTSTDNGGVFQTSSSVPPADLNSVALTAIQFTIIPARLKPAGGSKYLVKDLQKFCTKYGLNPHARLRAELEERINVFCHEKHVEEGTDYMHSLCFVSQHQEIDRLRARANGDDVNRKSKIAKKRRGDDTGSVGNNKPRSRDEFVTYKKKNPHHHSLGKRGTKQDWYRTVPLQKVEFKYPEHSFFECRVQSVDDPSRYFNRIGCLCCGHETSKFKVTSPNNNVGMGVTGEMDKIKAHVKSSRHQKNLKQMHINNRKQKDIEALMAKKKEAVSVETKTFRSRMLAACAKDGHKPTSMFAKGSAIRNLLESDHKSPKNLVDGKQMKIDHEMDLLEAEVKLIRKEICGRDLGMVYDETPRNGELGAMVLRYVDDGDLVTATSSSSSSSSSSPGPASYFNLINERPPKVCQRVCALSMDAFSLDAPAQVGMLNGMLTQCQGRHSSSIAMHGAAGSWSKIKAVMSDGVSTNIKALQLLRQTGTNTMNIGAEFTNILCFAHMFSNAGKEIGFSILNEFWNSIINLFSRSDKAKGIWKEVTNQSWKTHSETRWWSSFIILRAVHRHFHLLPTIGAKCVQQAIGAKSTAKLMALLNSPEKLNILKIELTAIVKYGSVLCDTTYQHEGDGQEVFDFAEAVESVLDQFPNEKVDLNGGDANIDMVKAIDRAIITTKEIDGGKSDAAILEAQEARKTLEQRGVRLPATIVQDITNKHAPRRKLARKSARNALAGYQSALTPRQKKDAQAEIERQEKELAEAEVEFEKELEAALAVEAALIAAAPPQTRDAWMSHIESGLGEMVKYIFARVKEEDGDRHASYELFQAARLWRPKYAMEGASNLDFSKTLIDTLFKRYNCITEDLRDRLKGELLDYRKDAVKVHSKIKDVLKWHWNHRRSRPAFYEAAKLLALVQPHSAAAERVFSIVTNRFGTSVQGMVTTLGSWIRLSIMLSVNGRDV